MNIQDLIDSDEQYVIWHGFDDAIVGLAERCASGPVVVYDYDRMVKILMDRDGVGFTDAAEYVDFNILGAYIGEQTPWILTRTFDP